MEAAACGRQDCLSLIIRYGADLNASDNRGWTAAMHAAFRGELGCLQLLIENGAKVECEDFLGTTPLMRAAISGHVKCVRFLLEHGANPHKRDKHLGIEAVGHARRKGKLLCALAMSQEPVCEAF